MLPGHSINAIGSCTYQKPPVFPLYQEVEFILQGNKIFESNIERTSVIPYVLQTGFAYALAAPKGSKGERSGAQLGIAIYA